MKQRPVLERPEDVLRTAALVIEQHGWAQAVGVRSDGALCVLQAVLLTEASPSVLDRAVSLLRERVRSKSVVQWNDQLGRTRGQILGALRGEGIYADA